MSIARSSIRGSSLSPKRSERQTNFKVVIRIRPPLERELAGEVPFKNIVNVHSNEQTVTISDHLESIIDERGEILANTGPYNGHSFVFDHVYDQHSSQKKVFETTARTVVDSALTGYNATIFAYGQTGTGKTYTMEGYNHGSTTSETGGNIGVEARGIIPRAIEQIFGHIQRNASPRMRFLVRASYLQIYNEQISDLLKPERSNLLIREDKKKGVYVEGLSEWVVRSPAEIYGLMERGGIVRATGETRMNEQSSRSHAVFIVIAEQSETVYVDNNGVEMSADEFNKFMYEKGVRREGDMNRLEKNIRQSFKVGKLNIVDLAGSERVRLSGAAGQRLVESKQINKSLSALGNVISALTETKNKRAHIPYRDSKLTRMLEDSLGGNCKTTMMAMCSPALEAMAETLSTLKFANRAKNIKNEAKVNEDLDQKSLLRKYERELKKLRAELEARSKNVVDKRRLLELDEQRRRAEADKMAAMRALEMRSKEFMQEKEEKKRLEQRIAMLMGQMIRGERGGIVGGSEGLGEEGVAGPEVQVLIKEQQDKMRLEYEGKLADLERERETIVEEKAQVDRYKQLLLKQRDIMIALTQRLVERDEQIVSLQDELDAYDKHHKELEEKLDAKTAMLIKFQRISMEVNANSPFKSEELSKALEAVEKENDGRRIVFGKATELSQDDEDSTNTDNIRFAKNGNNSTADAHGVVDKIGDIVTKKWRECQQQIRNEETRSGGQANTAIASRYMKHMVSTLLEEMQEVAAQSPVTSSSSTASLPRHDANASKLDAVLAENKRLSNKLREVTTASPRNTGTPKLDMSGLSDAQTTRLQDRCEVLVKERQAVHTIMEQKIKVLVQSVAQAVGVVLHNVQGGGSTGNALAKDVAALQRLVNASIAALRNAASSSSDSSGDSPALSSSGAPGSNYQKQLNSGSGVPPSASSGNGSGSGNGSRGGSLPQQHHNGGTITRPTFAPPQIFPPPPTSSRQFHSGGNGVGGQQDMNSAPAMTISASPGRSKSAGRSFYRGAPSPVSQSDPNFHSHGPSSGRSSPQVSSSMNGGNNGNVNGSMSSAPRYFERPIGSSAGQVRR